MHNYAFGFVGSMQKILYSEVCRKVPPLPGELFLAVLALSRGEIIEI
jgi:hypothetical protein